MRQRRDKANAPDRSTGHPGPAERASEPPGSPAHLLHLQRTVGNAAVARMVSPRDPDAPDVRRSSVHDVLGSSGRPLERPVRADMESRFDADFSDVRLHTGTAAQRSATEIGARAYTSGNHIVLGTGGADEHALAHELAHVLQQRSGPVSGTDHGNGLAISDPSDRFEREAEATARRVMTPATGEPVQTSASVPHGVLARTPASGEGNASGKRKREENEEPGERSLRRSGRREQPSSVDPRVINSPTLTFDSHYTGVTTQRLGDTQNFEVYQEARLIKPEAAPEKAEKYYDFRQKVRDKMVFTYPENGRRRQKTFNNMKKFVQDKYYRPPYEDTQIENKPNEIVFRDEPGLGTDGTKAGDRRIPADRWLLSWEVHFQWHVKSKLSGGEWISPEVHHTVEAPWNDGADVTVTHRSSPAHARWTVDLSGDAGESSTG